MERDNPRTFIDETDISEQSGYRLRRLLPHGQRDHLSTLMWRLRLEQAGSLTQFIKIWCPECPKPDDSRVILASLTLSTHQTFEIGSLLSSEALVSLR